MFKLIPGFAQICLLSIADTVHRTAVFLKGECFPVLHHTVILARRHMVIATSERQRVLLFLTYLPVQNV